MLHARDASREVIAAHRHDLIEFKLISNVFVDVKGLWREHSLQARLSALSSLALALVIIDELLEFVEVVFAKMARWRMEALHNSLEIIIDELHFLDRSSIILGQKPLHFLLCIRVIEHLLCVCFLETSEYILECYRFYYLAIFVVKCGLLVKDWQIVEHDEITSRHIGGLGREATSSILCSSLAFPALPFVSLLKKDVVVNR